MPNQLIGHLCFFTPVPFFYILYISHSKAAGESRKDVCSFPDSAGPSGRSRSPRQRSISKQGESQNNYGYVIFMYCVTGNFGGGFNLAIAIVVSIAKLKTVTNCLYSSLIPSFYLWVIYYIYPTVRLQESIEKMFAVFLTVLDLQDVVGLQGREASQSKENLKTTMGI